MWFKSLKLSGFMVIISLLLPQFAVAGDSRGGGDALTEGPASVSDIRSTIEGVKIPAAGFFNQLEFGWTFTDQLDNSYPFKQTIINTYKKLFKPDNGRTVFDEMKLLKFDIKEQGACKDLDGKEVDASAFNTAPNEICFSLERLSKKVGRFSMSMQITALAAHEFSHRVGTTEDEAVFLQMTAIEMLSNKTSKDMPELKKDLARRLENLQQEIKAVFFSVDNKTGTLDICGNITSIMGSSVALQDSYLQISNHYGIELLRAASLGAMTGLTLKVMAAQQFCLPEDNPKKYLMRQFYSGKSQVSLREFTQKVAENNKTEHMLDPGDGSILYLKFEDMTALRAELVDIQNTVSKLQAEVGATPNPAPTDQESDFSKQMAVVKATDDRLDQATSQSKLQPREISCPNLKITMGATSLYTVELAPGTSYGKKLENMACLFSSKNPLIIKCDERSARKYLNSFKVYPSAWNSSAGDQPTLGGSNARAMTSGDDGIPQLMSITFSPESCNVSR